MCALSYLREVLHKWLPETSKFIIVDDIVRFIVVGVI